MYNNRALCCSKLTLYTVHILLKNKTNYLRASGFHNAPWLFMANPSSNYIVIDRNRYIGPLWHYYNIKFYIIIITLLLFRARLKAHSVVLANKDTVIASFFFSTSFNNIWISDVIDAIDQKPICLLFSVFFLYVRRRFV